MAKQTNKAAVNGAPVEKTCCICGSTYTHLGCNPWPITDEGRCCQNCTNEYVIPARILFPRGELLTKDELDKINLLKAGRRVFCKI